MELNVATIAAAVAIAGAVGAAVIVFRGASARALIELQDKRIALLEKDAGDCKDEVRLLREESRVLTEKVTGAAKVAELAQVIADGMAALSKEHESLRADHAAIGGTLAERNLRTRERQIP